jgi:hypothetical protein
LQERVVLAIELQGPVGGLLAARADYALMLAHRF